jgi:hypothetical protein
MKTIAVAATGILLASGVAWAQPGAMVPPPQPTEPAERSPDSPDSTFDAANPAGPNPALGATSDTGAATTIQTTGMRPWMSRTGAAVMLGGGFEDFTNSSIRSMTGGGGSWTARVVGGTRQAVGIEAAYVGAARNINGFGLGDGARLVSNGVEGAVRANVPIETGGRGLLLPFAFVGLGWQHYSLMNGPAVNVSAVSGSDDVMSLPYGAGLEYSYGMFIADARFTYRYTFMNDLMRTGGGRLSTYGVTAQVGVEF